MADADRLARELDRSRSWVVAEALRQYVAHQDRAAAPALDASRREQVRRDLTLTAEARVHEAEATLAIGAPNDGAPAEAPRRFATYEEFEAWRDAQPRA